MYILTNFDVYVVMVVPCSLFELSALRELDVSHNTLQWVSRDIANLSSLQRLNVDGNQLCGLPASFLRLKQITHLSISDNLTHPLLWRENTRNQPQMLVDLASVVLGSCVSALDDEELPSSVRTALQRYFTLCSGVHVRHTFLY